MDTVYPVVCNQTQGGGVLLGLRFSPGAVLSVAQPKQDGAELAALWCSCVYPPQGRNSDCPGCVLFGNRSTMQHREELQSFHQGGDSTES